MKPIQIPALLLAVLLGLCGCSLIGPGSGERLPILTTPPTTQAMPPDNTTPSDTSPTQTLPTEPPAPAVLPRFEGWLARNLDFVGWITVPGTIIDYPVVYCADNTFYLSHDIDTYSDPDGTIFLVKEAGLLDQNRSWSLFGHHRKNGRMFSDLHKYKKLAFLQQSPVFTFDTLYQESEYVIFSVFYMAGNQSDAYFYYYPRAEFGSDRDFLAHVAQLTARSIYDIPVSVEADDQLVILSCCSYETDDLRIAVAGRKLRDGERAEDFDTAEYAVAAAPLYPKKWYDKYGGAAPEGVIESLYGQPG